MDHAEEKQDCWSEFPIHTELEGEVQLKKCSVCVAPESHN